MTAITHLSLASQLRMREPQLHGAVDKLQYYYALAYTNKLQY